MQQELTNKLQQLYEDALSTCQQGSPADYIPALAKANAQLFAVSIASQQLTTQLGDSTERFTLQSIVKVISFMVATEARGVEEVMHYVDLEPTGDAFNSMIRLESSKPGKPFNPMINAGAITIASLLHGTTPNEKVDTVLDFLEQLLHKRPSINGEVFLSEFDTAHRNRAIAYHLKANGFIVGDVETALKAYLLLCSIEVTTQDLAKMGLFLATDGEGAPFISPHILKITKALMMTCGMYNASGKVAAFIGIPAKSGVSGGVLACLKDATIEGHHGAIGIGLFSPAIDDVGNSVASMHMLKQLADHYHLSYF
ncbi:glutaminase 2 [Lysinibacillus alkalisoli]|uniref:Glutaminase n=1 Tax=Lysinibacillus alkalisoli TaxID=1911548 RepID=A0A917FUQ8_9BACI|nr:glutaminase A [Lysinibacillus alkalisoli]GGG10655.1 glutaminase 2 [Lysinibacillus alkalisoli]